MSLHYTIKNGFRVISWVTILATLGTMCLFYYLYFFQGNPPIEFLNLPFPVDKKVYHPGDTITLLDKYNRHIDALVTRSVYLIDSYPIPLELTTDRGITPVGSGTVLLSFTIPPNYIPAEGDDYYVSGTSIYHVNFLRDRPVPWRSETFHILPVDGTKPRPSVHHPSATDAVAQQQLIQLIERSHPAVSSSLRSSSSKTSSSQLSAATATSSSSRSVSSVSQMSSSSLSSAASGSSSSPSGVIEKVISPLVEGLDRTVENVQSAASIKIVPLLP